jgi:hypothetical protein
MARPFWTGRQIKNQENGQFREEIKAEFLIWRPIMGGFVTLTEVKNGTASLIDLLKINALMDSQAAAEAEAMERAK